MGCKIEKKKNYIQYEKEDNFKCEGYIFKWKNNKSYLCKTNPELYQIRHGRPQQEGIS